MTRCPERARGISPLAVCGGGSPRNFVADDLLRGGGLHVVHARDGLLGGGGLWRRSGRRAAKLWRPRAGDRAPGSPPPPPFDDPAFRAVLHPQCRLPPPDPEAY